MAGGAGYAQKLTSTMVYVSKNNCQKMFCNGFCVQKMAEVVRSKLAVWKKMAVHQNFLQDPIPRQYFGAQEVFNLI